MSDGQGRKAVTVPGPSLTTAGTVQVAVEAAQRAILALQGAAGVFRSLGR